MHCRVLTLDNSSAVCKIFAVRELRLLDSLTNNLKEVATMESLILLELLKLLWLGFEVVKHFISRKREKALIATLEKYDQRLNQLESRHKEIP